MFLFAAAWAVYIGVCPAPINEAFKTKISTARDMLHEHEASRGQTSRDHPKNIAIMATQYC